MRFCALLLLSVCRLLAAQTFDVRSYGAVGDGTHLDTAAIAAAIKAAAAAGGGVVAFPPGRYVTGTFELLSNVSLELRAGSVILGSPNLADYGSIGEYGFTKAYGVSSSGEGDKVGIIVARQVENIAIFGQGAIDGNSGQFFDFDTPHIGSDFDARYTRDEKAFLEVMRSTEDGPVKVKPEGRPGTLIILSNARNVIIRDVTLTNAPNWTLHLQHSRHAVVTGIRIANDLRIPNNDGVDCIDCHDVHFSNCDISAGDDDFAIVGSQDVTVADCSLTSHSSGIRLEDTRFATFSNLTIHANRGIGVYERGGGLTSDVLFSNVVMETRLLAGHWWGKGEPIYIASGGPGNADGGVRNVRFSNILADAEGGILIYGTKESPVRDIGFDRVRLRIHAPRAAVARGAGGNFDLRWTATSLAGAVFAHDIPAVYCRYLAGLKVRGFELEWDRNLPDYFSNALSCEDFSGLDLEDFSARQAAADAPQPVILLRNGVGVSIRGSVARAGSGTFLSLSGVSGLGLFVNNDVAAARRVVDPNPSGFTISGNRLPLAFASGR
ncbi:MAG TPA: glycosyl hydrolase family 28-related protein [Bryobacteraceae bacterium]|nr:glycosyl hydrolase family 28-related protein [Bryobacteraceae bacterium]